MGVFQGSTMNGFDWAEDRTWAPHEDTRDVSTSEEKETIEEGSDYDDSDDEDYIPPLCVQ